MQKITVTFIYGKDETRKLKYRMTDDVPLRVIIEKLISFQFIIDCADPGTFTITCKGQEINDLNKNFEDCNIIDGDEIYLMPTIFDPIPPAPEPEAPQKNNRNKNSKPVSVLKSENYKDDNASSDRAPQNHPGNSQNSGTFKRNNHYGQRNRPNYQRRDSKSEANNSGNAKVNSAPVKTDADQRQTRTEDNHSNQNRFNDSKNAAPRDNVSNPKQGEAKPVPFKGKRNYHGNNHSHPDSRNSQKQAPVNTSDNNK
ncbi:MAG: hypothetical protein Q8882_09370 [Bacillota bacterium]|nr:hypothetical protein [Bacillota bacterium]